MAWVTQTFGHGDKEVNLYEDAVFIQCDRTKEGVWFDPTGQDEAHGWALMLRRAARRLEEIGKGLP